MTDHVWTVRLGWQLRVWLHKVGVHTYVPTYRIEDGKLTRTLECAFCPRRIA